MGLVFIYFFEKFPNFSVQIYGLRSVLGLGFKFWDLCLGAYV